MKLIDGWRSAARLWSVRLPAAASLLFGLLLTFPDQALSLWNVMPVEVQDLVPNRSAISLILFIAAIFARIFKQPAISDGK